MLVKRDSNFELCITLLAIASTFLGSRLISLSLGYFELYPLRLFSIIGLFCIIISPHRPVDIFLGLYNKISLLLLGIGAVSILWVPDLTLAFKEYGLLVSGVIQSLLIVRNINSVKRVNLVMTLWIVGSIFVNILGLWEVINHKHIVAVQDYAIAADERLMDFLGFLAPRSIFSNQNNYAYFNSLSALIFLGMLVKPYKRKLIYVLNIVAFVLALLLLFYSYSRAGMMSFLLGMLIFMFFAVRSNTKHRKVFMRFVLAAIVMVVFLAIYTDLPLSLVDKIVLIAEKQQIANDESRFFYYKTCLQYSLDHFGIGMGPGSSIHALNNASVHNHLLQLLVEYGIVNLFALILLLFFAYVRITGFRHVSNNFFPFILATTIIVFPIHVIGPSSILGEGIYWLWLGLIVAVGSTMAQMHVESLSLTKTQLDARSDNQF